jgi:hypothetical protein
MTWPRGPEVGRGASRLRGDDAPVERKDAGVRGHERIDVELGDLRVSRHTIGPFAIEVRSDAGQAGPGATVVTD